jgi:hypothetical protein
MLFIFILFYMLSTKAPTKSEKSEIKTEQKIDQRIDQKIEQKTDQKIEQKTEQKTDNKTIINIFNPSSDSVILIDHDQVNKKFILKSNSNVIGYFTAGQILKYLNQNVEGYLLSIDLNISQNIIEQFLIKDGVLLTHLESPISGNIDILIKIYKDVQLFIEESKAELEKLDDKTLEEVQKTNKKFIYDILSQIIKIFTMFSGTVSQTKITPELQTSILKYTAGAVYRLSSLLHDDIELLQEKIKLYKLDIDDLKSIKSKFNEKIQNFEIAIKIQNEKLDKIILNIKDINTNTKQDLNTESLQMSQTNNNINNDTDTDPNPNPNPNQSIQLGGSITSVDTIADTSINTPNIMTEKISVSKSTSSAKSSAISSAISSTLGGYKKSIRLSTLLEDNSDKTISFNQE